MPAAGFTFVYPKKHVSHGAGGHFDQHTHMSTGHDLHASMLTETSKGLSWFVDK